MRVKFPNPHWAHVGSSAQALSFWEKLCALSSGTYFDWRMKSFLNSSNFKKNLQVWISDCSSRFYAFFKHFSEYHLVTNKLSMFLIFCRYLKPSRINHMPPLMEGEALAARVLEMGPVAAKFLGSVLKCGIIKTLSDFLVYLWEALILVYFFFKYKQ